MYVYIYVCVCVCVCMYVCVYMCAYVCVHVYVFTYRIHSHLNTRAILLVSNMKSYCGLYYILQCI